MSYLSGSAVVIHYEEALYQVYAPLPLPFLPRKLYCGARVTLPLSLRPVSRRDF